MKSKERYYPLSEPMASTDMKGFVEGIIVSPSYQCLTSNQSLEDKLLVSQ